MADNNNFLSVKDIFRSLKYRNYRLFFYGQGISMIGTWMQRIAMPWLVYRLTDSAFLLGLVGFAGQFPTFLLAPFAGVLTDRWNRHRILIATQILAMAQSLLLAVLYFIGIINVWHIVAMSIFLGLVNAFDMPARQSLVISMVEKKEDLGNAIALNSAMVNAARLLGPAIAGALVAVTGEGVCFLINGLSYLLVVWSLMQMRIAPVKGERKRSHIFRELKEGFDYTFGLAPLKYVIMLLALVSLMGMPYAVLMPVFSKEILHGGSHTFGFLMGASGLGALAGAIYLASRKSVLGLGKIIPLSTIIFGSGLIAFSFCRVVWLSLILMVITGIGMTMQMAASNTILQTIADDDKRGRVMSFYSMAFMGTAPFGSLLAGWLANVLGVSNTFLATGAICILGALIFINKLPELKRAVHPIYVKSGIIPEISQGLQTAAQLTVPPED